MNSETSVSCWIRELQGGNQAAAQQLWERYFQRLVRLAKQKLNHHVRRHADEEDVALSAFKSFFRGVEAGRYPQLADRDDLWRLLVTITAHKAIEVARHSQRQKRGGKTDYSARDNDGNIIDLNKVIGEQPSPEFSAQVAEEFDRLLALLDDSSLQSVAVWKMEGYTSAEIAPRLRCTVRTVERKLRSIRQIWEEALES
jgi:RNA polymerase sigma factor (sigma-70 family)